jgi:hypothetical protein
VLESASKRGTRRLKLSKDIRIADRQRQRGGGVKPMQCMPLRHTNDEDGAAGGASSQAAAGATSAAPAAPGPSKDETRVDVPAATVPMRAQAQERRLDDLLVDAAVLTAPVTVVLVGAARAQVELGALAVRSGSAAAAATAAPLQRAGEPEARASSTGARQEPMRHSAAGSHGTAGADASDSAAEGRGVVASTRPSADGRLSGRRGRAPQQEPAEAADNVRCSLHDFPCVATRLTTAWKRATQEAGCRVCTAALLF